MNDMIKKMGMMGKRRMRERKGGKREEAGWHKLDLTNNVTPSERLDIKEKKKENRPRSSLISLMRWRGDHEGTRCLLAPGMKVTLNCWLLGSLAFIKVSGGGDAIPLATQLRLDRDVAILISWILVDGLAPASLTSQLEQLAPLPGNLVVDEDVGVGESSSSSLLPQV